MESRFYEFCIFGSCDCCMSGQYYYYCLFYNILVIFISAMMITDPFVSIIIKSSVGYFLFCIFFAHFRLLLGNLAQMRTISCLLLASSDVHGLTIFIFSFHTCKGMILSACDLNYLDSITLNPFRFIINTNAF